MLRNPVERETWKWNLKLWGDNFTATFWFLFGRILLLFWRHFGFILALFWFNFDPILNLNCYYSCWSSFVTVCNHFDNYSANFWISLENLLRFLFLSFFLFLSRYLVYSYLKSRIFFYCIGTCLREKKVSDISYFRVFTWQFRCRLFFAAVDKSKTRWKGFSVSAKILWKVHSNWMTKQVLFKAERESVTVFKNITTLIRNVFSSLPKLNLRLWTRSCIMTWKTKSHSIITLFLFHFIKNYLLDRFISAAACPILVLLLDLFGTFCDLKSLF